MIFLKQQGFTLVEVIVVLAIFSILIFGVCGLLISIVQNPKFYLVSMDTIDQAMLVSFKFSDEIRAAAYGSYPLIEAGDSEITFYSPVGASSGVVNKIHYYLEDGVLYKGVIAPSGGVYDPYSETITPVLSGISGDQGPLFSYYSGDYDGILSVDELPEPVNITEVRFVRINLLAQYQLSVESQTDFLSAAGSAIRTLKDNLSDPYEL